MIIVTNNTESLLDRVSKAHLQRTYAGSRVSGDGRASNPDLDNEGYNW
jgi:hypothetical protein